MDHLTIDDGYSETASVVVDSDPDQDQIPPHDILLQIKISNISTWYIALPGFVKDLKHI